MVDRIADAINTIKTNERIGRRECTLYSTKMIKAILDVMGKSSYIAGYTEFTEGRTARIRVHLSNRINSIGVIKPRHAVKASDIQKYEMRYIPSRDFGILILSTPKGLMTNKEAKEQSIGGRLIAYVY
jgi:small subunit ribosomal protein S8